MSDYTCGQHDPMLFYSDKMRVKTLNQGDGRTRPGEHPVNE
jgi:hypothetical protein